MEQLKFKKNLICYGTEWEFNGQIYGSQIFAKSLEEAEEMLKEKRTSEKTNGQIISRYCLNPNKVEEEYNNLLKDMPKE